MANYKHIIFFTILIICSVNCIDLISIEQQPLFALAQKINDINLNVAGLESKICNGYFTDCYCDADGYLSGLILKANSTNSINWDDFIGFSKLENLVITNVYLSDQYFLYNSTKLVPLLEIHTYSNLIIDKPLPQNTLITEFNLNVINPPVLNIKASYFSKLVFFSIKNPVNIENDLSDPSGNEIEVLRIVSPNLPNVMLFQNLSSFYFDSTRYYFNQSTLSNLQSFNSIIELKLTFPSIISYDFPIGLSLIQNPKWIYVELNGNWNPPSEYIDFSNHKVSNSYFTISAGPKFNINGSFPFSKISSGQCEYFNFINGNLTTLPDLKIFNNVKQISLFSNVGGNLPSAKDSLQKSRVTHTFDLTGNKLTGTIDESWCSIDLKVSNNALSGLLPDCYYCYQNDPTYRYRLIGNNFTNIDINPACTYEQISVYKIIINENSATLIGKNIGINLNNIITDPLILFNTNNLNDSFTGTIFGNISSYDFINIRFKIPGINFTLSLGNNPPAVSNFSTSGLTVNFIGQYFSYNKSAIIVKIYNGKEFLDCTVQSSIFSEIICKLDFPVFSYDSWSDEKSVLYVDGMNTSFVIKLMNSTINNGYCDGFTKECYCYNGWTTLSPGPYCVIPNHYISTSSKVPSTTGGNISLFGWFGDIHNNIEVIINNTPLPIQSIDNETIVITISPGVGSKNIQVIQNNITWTGLIYPYSELTIKCLNDCSGNGVCNNSNGECKCNENYIGLDCLTKASSSTPPSQTHINPNGSTLISNEDTIFLIYFESINEIDFNNNQIQNSSINLKNGWKIDKNNSNSIESVSSITTFYQNINNITIIMTIENIESNNGKEFTFAGNQFTVSKDGFKLSLSVSNWNYKSNLNTLQIQMSSDVSLNEGNKTNECIDSDSKSTNVETSSNSNDLQNVNYLKISKNGKTLYGRFQTKMLSDGRPTTTITKVISKDDKKILISLNMPHCNECLLDPDFSVVINPDFKSSDSCGKENKKPWLIPVAVTVPIVGCALIIASFLLTMKILRLKKEKIRMKIALKNFK
ncbi:hypothetical protein RB653_010405 [Dictyostelium firmibasis]|uniref:EGF-like domain-containing protein n=1 Tax=Dictyostelium firmibasis TaxID=79012 RepID=A0AAN7YL08_9MYCE